MIQEADHKQVVQCHATSRSPFLSPCSSSSHRNLRRDSPHSNLAPTQIDLRLPRSRVLRPVEAERTIPGMEESYDDAMVRSFRENGRAFLISLPLLQRWILAGAPTDADYALYILRKRGAEGRAIRGSKTIKRMARKERSRASSSADLTLDKHKVRLVLHSSLWRGLVTDSDIRECIELRNRYRTMHRFTRSPLISELIVRSTVSRPASTTYHTSD